ncbi:hypothetical protein D1871_15850 [Nakamurella silvestris]|nr:hypothetical protein D1871_15850 [Nakamurella silvestris]
MVTNHQGDLYLPSGRIEIRGRVRGNVRVAGGGNLLIGRASTVTGTVHLLAGAAVEIRGKAGNLELTPGSFARVEGLVEGYVHNPPGSEVLITGTVSGHLTHHHDRSGTPIAAAGRVLHGRTCQDPAARSSGATPPGSALLVDLAALAALPVYSRLSAYFRVALPVDAATVTLDPEQIDQLSVLLDVSPQTLRTQLIRGGLVR